MGKIDIAEEDGNKGKKRYTYLFVRPNNTRNVVTQLGKDGKREIIIVVVAGNCLFQTGRCGK